MTKKSDVILTKYLYVIDLISILQYNLRFFIKILLDLKEWLFRWILNF